AVAFGKRSAGADSRTDRIDRALDRRRLQSEHDTTAPLFFCALSRTLQLREPGMSRLATTWSELRAWSATHGAELRLCVRSTPAAVLTLAAAQVLHLPIALWAVLTAVILTQISVGRSLKASMDYLVSTLGGAIYAGAIGAFVPHDNSLAVFAGLTLALAPAVLLAALNARFSAAPFTAVMVFFGPTITHTGPIAAAFQRVIEVAVGCVVGLFVALVVLPARAHDFVIEAATQMRRAHGALSARAVCWLHRKPRSTGARADVEPDRRRLGAARSARGPSAFSRLALPSISCACICATSPAASASLRRRTALRLRAWAATSGGVPH